MAFNPRKYLTEEQINEIVDPISLAIGAGVAGLAGFGIHKFLSGKQRKAAEAAAEKQAGEAYETGLGRGKAAGQAEGMLSGIDAGKELLAREQYLRRAHERAGMRESIAQHFGDPEIIKDARDHYRKLQTGWHTILSQSNDADRGYVNAPHTFHLAVDRIKLHKDQRTSDDTAKYVASYSQGHDKIIQLIRSEGRRVGDQGLDALTRTLVHHKHHGDEDVMKMARTLVGHIANRTEDRYSRGTGGHEFHPTREVAYHPDLPHHTNSTHEAENLRHTILKDLFAGTYKPDERVLDVATSRGTYVDHARHGKILDVKSVSRDRRAFEVDRAARPEIAGQRWAGAGENISAGDPVNLWGSAVEFHGQPVNSNAGREFAALVTRSAQEYNQHRIKEQKEREKLEKEARIQAAAEAAAKAAEEAARQTPPLAQGQVPVAPPAVPTEVPAASTEAPRRGRGRPKKPKAEGDKPKGRGRPKKLKEAMDFYTWMIDRQMKTGFRK